MPQARKTPANPKPAAKRSPKPKSPVPPEEQLPEVHQAPAGDVAADEPLEAVEAVADRLRQLNERIIAAGRSTGIATLDGYEKALSAIAATLERGPGRSDIEWLSSLATAQAKFLRDVTQAWTSAARKLIG
jgi:hypothetical protein